MMISMMLLMLARAKACGDRVVEVLDTDIDIVNPKMHSFPKIPRARLNLKMLILNMTLRITAIMCFKI